MDDTVDILSIESDLSELSHEENKAIEKANTDSPIIIVHEYTDNEMNTLVQFIQKMTVLFNLKDSDWTAECVQLIQTWLTDVHNLILIIYFDNNRLCAAMTFPKIHIFDLTYFLREPGQQFNVDTFHDSIVFGNIHKDVDGDLLDVLEMVFMPILFNSDNGLSQNIYSPLKLQLHKFLAFLSGMHNKLFGLTVLYIPKEGRSKALMDAANDREFLTRLEAVVVYWIHQIRSCISDMEHALPHNSVCIPDEYNFWINRLVTLQTLCKQIESVELQRILAILETAQSIYLKQFNDLTKDFYQEISDARLNIKFLKILVEPCLDLNQCDNPIAVIAKLPQIVRLIRVLWINSTYFHAEEKISELFRLLSNQIIIFCGQKLNVADILRDQPKAGLKMCDMAMTCCYSYKEIFRQLLKDYEPEVDINNFVDEVIIFNHVDGFIQRLTDLIEICESMIIFGNYADTDTDNSKPCGFGGIRGSAFDKTADDIKRNFENGLHRIVLSSAAIFDLHAQIWYTEIAAFRSLLRILDASVANLIFNVFLTIKNPEEGVDALYAIFHYSQRLNLRPIINQKTTEVWLLLREEIRMTNTDVQEQFTDCFSVFPNLTSSILMMQINLKRLTRLKNIIFLADWLPPNAHSSTISDAYQAIQESFRKKMFHIQNGWTKALTLSDILAKLNRPLLCRSVTYPGLLECNIDRWLLRIIDEINHDMTMGYDAPLEIVHLLPKFKTIRITYQSVITVALDYNQILRALSVKERLLFRQMIQSCDRKIVPGIYKLNWSGELSSAYISECVKHTDQLKKFIYLYKSANESIVFECERICDIKIIDLPLPAQHGLSELQQHLKSFQGQAILSISRCYQKIIELIYFVFDGFANQIEKMVGEWTLYVQQFDSLLQEAVVSCFRASLLAMYNLLHGNATSETQELFVVQLNLVDDALEYDPKIVDLANTISSIFPNLIQMIDKIPRLSTRLKLPTDKNVQNFKAAILSNKECFNLNLRINQEVRVCTNLIDNFTDFWKSFKTEMDLNKQATIQECERSSPSMELVQMHFTRNADYVMQVSQQETTPLIYFVTVQCDKLKRALIAEIDVHKRVVKKRLKQRTTALINDFNKRIDADTHQLLVQPRDATDLLKSIEFYEITKDATPSKEAEHSAIDKYVLCLDELEIVLATETRSVYNMLATKWKQYMAALHSANLTIENAKDGNFDVLI